MRADFPRRRNLALLCVFWFLRDFQLWYPVWVVFLTLERGFSLTSVTVADGLFLVGVVLLEVPTGAVADRWGRSRSMGLGALLLGVAVLIFAFANSFTVLLASFLLWSLAQTLMSGADLALLFDTLKTGKEEHRYERFAGIATATMWAAAGTATLFGGPIAALLDIRGTIFIGAGTCLIAAAAAFAMREPPRETTASSAPYLRSIHLAFAEILPDRRLLLVILLAGSAGAGLHILHYVVQPYLIDRGVEVGLLFSMLQVPIFFAGIVGGLLAARLTRAAGVVRMLLVLPAIGAFGAFALAAAPGLTAFAALPLATALAAAMEPIVGGYINRRVGSERRATILSINGMVLSLGMAAGAPLMGFVADTWSIEAAFAAGGAAVVAALLISGVPLALHRGDRPRPLAPAITPAAD
jgi:MFS family permease